MREDLAAFGLQLVDDESEPDEEEAREPQPFRPGEVDEDGFMGVLPEIWDSVRVFHACWNQWHIVPIPGGMAGGAIWYEGMDNSKVRDTMAMMNVKNERQVLEDLRVMEAEARVERNRKANQK